MSQKTATQKTAPGPVNKPQGKRKFVPFLTENFNIKNFSLTDLEIHNERNKSHMISYPRNNESTFVFQTPEFSISQYGIPPLGEYAKTDAQRTTLKLPLDPEQLGCMQMESMFSQIDTYMRANQKKIFTGSVANMKFSYKSIVREPKKDILIPDPKAKKGSQPESSTPKKPKCKFWKAKLDLTYPEGKIQTILFVRDPANPEEKPKRVTVETASELEQYMPWGSKVRMIVMMNKIWAEKNPKDEEVPQKFGLSFKVLSIETTPREKSVSYRDDIANYAFIDNEEETDEAIPNKLDSGTTENEEEEVEEVEEEEVEEEEVVSEQIQTSVDPKLLEQVNNMQKQVAESQTRLDEMKRKETVALMESGKIVYLNEIASGEPYKRFSVKQKETMMNRIKVEDLYDLHEVASDGFKVEVKKRFDNEVENAIALLADNTLQRMGYTPGSNNVNGQSVVVVNEARPWMETVDKLYADVLRTINRKKSKDAFYIGDDHPAMAMINRMCEGFEEKFYHQLMNETAADVLQADIGVKVATISRTVIPAAFRFITAFDVCDVGNQAARIENIMYQVWNGSYTAGDQI